MIDWDMLSKNPAAIDLLEQNPDKINYMCLSMNPNAVHLFEKIPDKIENIYYILSNPSIFEYDYAEMKLNMSVIFEELMMKTWHPSRVQKWINEGDENMLDV
jgi:hypothetical protein